jgi:hypothetical protein
MEMEKVPQAGYQIVGIDIAGFNRSSLIKNIGLPFKLVKSFFQVAGIIRSFKPTAVIGVGGYSSFPVLRYAQGKGIPTFIHESNSFAGKSNILLGNASTLINVSGTIYTSNIDTLTSNLSIGKNASVLQIGNISSIAFIDGSLNATTISSNGILINFNNYVTSNQLYGKIEKQYPPRKYDSSVITNTPTIFGKTNVITETITLNNGEYGAGDYIIYSSGIFQDRHKQNLFNYVINDSYSGGWGFKYIANEGNFNSSLTTYNINQPDNNYFGDWLIIKLPTSIVLSRFIFYPFLNTISRNPSLWRCYGSTNGSNFEIIDIACNNIALTASDYSKGYYEQKIPETFINSYLYYGFVFSKLVGGDSNATSLMFVELQLFGRDDTPSALFLTSLFNNSVSYNLKYGLSGNTTGQLLYGSLTNIGDYIYLIKEQDNKLLYFNPEIYPNWDDELNKYFTDYFFQ